mgnify:CR=1 FL=1
MKNIANDHLLQLHHAAVMEAAHDARSKELARALGSTAPLAFVAGRDAVLRSTESDLITGIDYERKLYAMLMATEDRDEGLAAYREKRPPDYKGR